MKKGTLTGQFVQKHAGSLNACIFDLSIQSYFLVQVSYFSGLQTNNRSKQQ